MVSSNKLMEEVFMFKKVNILKVNPMVYSKAFVKVNYGKNNKMLWEFVMVFILYIQITGNSLHNTKIINQMENSP